jgi:AraC-like DNA-binding protein
MADEPSTAYFAPLKLRPFLELADEGGVEVDAILAAHDTSRAEMLHPETRLPRLRCVAIIRALIGPLHDPLIGLRASQRSVLEDIDVLGYIARHCPNAMAALEGLRGYGRLLADASVVTLERAAGQVIIRVGLSGGRRSIPELADFAVGSGHVGLGLLTGGAARALRVELARPKPAQPSAYRAFFGAPVTFGATCGLAVYDEAALLAPLEQDDPRLRAILRQHADARLARLPPRSTLVDQVRASLARQCDAHAPSLGKLAAELHVSERTLTRHLQQAGVQYRVLLDEVRREHAQRLLETSELHISEIAQQLGFGDATAFGRAFRRWLGVTPSRYRQHAGRS